jgi:uncharacterized protein with GYD domain
MPKYLVIASYTAQGARGVLEGGGSARRAAVETALKSIGGRVDAFYFGFGSDDAYVLVDAPDNASAAAISLTASAAGGANARTIVLLTPEEIDKAAEKAKNAQYTPPGG